MPKKLLSTLSFLFFFFGFAQFAFGQLSDFSLTVTATNESCTANGTLTFSVANTAPGAAIQYSIFKLPDLTVPIAVLNSTTFTGLVAGDYRVIATQSLGNLSNTQQRDAHINRTIIDLDYTLSSNPEICGNDGKLTAHVLNSVGVAYEIIAGPVIRPLQPSNTFNNLPAGNYTVRVFDACGEGLVRTHTLYSRPAEVHISSTYYDQTDCETIHVFLSFGNSIAYPLTIQSTAHSASAGNSVFTSTNQNYSNYSFDLPVSGMPYTYDVNVTDGCGNHYFFNNIAVVVPELDFSTQINPLGCSGNTLTLYFNNDVNPVAVSFLAAPAGFNPLTFNANHPGPFSGSVTYYNNNVPLPPGNYSVKITDACGKTKTKNFTIGPPQPLGYFNYRMQPGCAPGKGSLNLYGSGLNLLSAQLVSAPAGYPYPLPQDLANYYTSGNIYMNSLPVGQYIFNATGSCNQTGTITVNVTEFNSGPISVDITENCDSFNLYLSQQTNGYVRYFLQKYYPAVGEWGDPISGATSPNTDNIFYYSSQLYPGNNTNIAASGTFRIMREIYTYGNGASTAPICISQVYQFDYYVGPRIIDVFSFDCHNSTYDALVQATGYAPLTYRITTKNGQPFFVNNGNSNVFLGLAPAIYNFQIEDGCGNILNSVFDISNPQPFPVTPTSFCSGQPASLSVPSFPFLSYQWWKDNNNSTILSTGGTLNFPAFNPANDNGIYHVRVFYEGNPNSCINFVLNYQISVPVSGPQAGNGQNVEYCGSQGLVDLFSLLSGNDPNGIWTEVTSSGALSGSLWNSDNVNFGSYQFHYTVTGLCNSSDQSTVNIRLKPIPEMPAADVEEPLCKAGNLMLLAGNIPFGTYVWTGPNGFISNEQNPVLTNISEANSGTYSVKSVADGCESGMASVEVLINPLPEFSLTNGCVNGQYQLNATLIDTGTNPESVSFSWTGPENYSGSGNPVVITNGKRGTYTATATNEQGCSFSASIDIPYTMCEFPAGISPNGDGLNESIDLTGMEVLKFKIYNRYGRMVFDQDNYTNQWHGQDFRDRELPDATYYYYIRLKTGLEKTGWVYVTK